MTMLTHNIKNANKTFGSQVDSALEGRIYFRKLLKLFIFF